MRRGRLILIFLLFILLVVLCLALFWRFQSGGQQAQPGQPQEEAVPAETIEVVVAAQDIRRGQRITEEMVTTAPMPVDMVIETQILNVEEAIGKLAARDLPRGIFLTKGDLVDTAEEIPATGSVAALQIPAGRVAITIPISRLTSVAYAVRPGDRVGILVTLPFVDLDPDFQSRLPNISGSVIQNALIIGSPTATQPTGQPAATGEGGAQFVGGETIETLVVQSVPGNAPIGKIEDQGDFTMYALPSEPSRVRMVTQMIVSDAIVLYVGTFPWQKPEALEARKAVEEAAEQQVPEIEQPAPPPEAEPKPPDVITLIVEPQDALTLKYLMDRKMFFTLVLRSVNDEGTITTDPVTLNYILEQYNLVVPSKQLFDLEPRVDKVEVPLLPNDMPPTPTPVP